MDSSPSQSRLSYLDTPTSFPPLSLPAPEKQQQPPPDAAPATLLSFMDQAGEPPATTTTTAPPAKADGGGSRAMTWMLRKDRAAASVMRAAVVVRVSAAVLCLIAFSVMAADKNRGWTLDSYDQYSEYRYCVAVNVIGFLYAAFQTYAEVQHMSSKKHIIGGQMGYYFDFAMDQILSYLLISASSSATSRTNYWVSNWGVDPFTNMISGSVAMSFLAFIAFAISSLISAYNLFSTRNR